MLIHECVFIVTFSTEVPVNLFLDLFVKIAEVVKWYGKLNLLSDFLYNFIQLQFNFELFCC